MEPNEFFSACKKGDIEFVEKFLDEGRNVNQIDKYGSTGLHLACRHSNYEIVILLLNRGIDMNKKNYWQFTPLDVAFYNFKYNPNPTTSIIRELILRGVNLRNDYKDYLQYKTNYVEEIIEIVESTKGYNIKPAVRN